MSATETKPLLTVRGVNTYYGNILALKGVVPSIGEISVGPDVVGGSNWDVALVADFADQAALDAYQTHPDHQIVVAYVRSVVADRVAVDFVI